MLDTIIWRAVFLGIPAYLSLRWFYYEHLLDYPPHPQEHPQEFLDFVDEPLHGHPTSPDPDE